MKVREIKKTLPKIFLAFFLALILGLIVMYNSKAILVKFELISINNVYTKFNLKYQKVKGASKYIIEIYDSNNNIAYTTETTKNNVNMIINDLNNREEYTVVVTAVSSSGEKRTANNNLVFTYYEPSFSDENVMLNNEDFDLVINGDLLEDYRIKVIKNNKEIINTDLTDDVFILNKELYLDESVRLDAYIYAGDNEVDRISLFNNMNPISEITINNPSNDSTIMHEDLLVDFKGGKNAEFYQIKLFESNKQIVNYSTQNHYFMISKDLMQLDKDYRLEIIGIRDDYTESSSVNFKVKAQEKLSPVYISNDLNSISKNMKIELFENADATIYYTLDGSNPTVNSTKYTNPIVIRKNTTIKAFSVKEGYENSNIKTFDIKLNDKKNLKVYINASNQINNLGIEGSGFTNEAEEMKELANLIKDELKTFDVDVKVDSTSSWKQESNKYNLKIALQTDMSVNANQYGIETWIDSINSNTYSLANLIQKTLSNNYHNKELVNYNRGVKYANGILSEANDKYHSNQMILKLGFNDNYEDAKWIHENKKTIAKNIADSILEYYGYIK